MNRDQLSLLIGLLLVGLAAILLIAATRLPLATELLQVAMILLGLFSMAGVSILVKWIEGSPVAPFAVITFDENHTRSVLEKVIDVQVANQSNESTTSSPWEPTSDRLLLEDPNLALAKPRIDLERALRRVAHHHDISIDLKRSPIHRLLEALVRKKVVEPRHGRLDYKREERRKLRQQ